MKIITQIKQNIGYTDNDIYDYLEKNYKLKRNEIKQLEIVKESIDSRKKPNVFYSLNIAIEVIEKALYKVRNLKDYVLDKNGLGYTNLGIKTQKKVVVVGFGPSGMFSGLVLAQSGLKPLIIEQGKSVEERQKDVENLWKNRVLNINSNVQFGEGGAGTFSDGKLNSNLDNSYCKKVINEFVINGAPQEIFYKSKPHIGSDNLPKVVKNIREKIKNLGGEVLFNTQLIDIKTKDNEIDRIVIKDLITEQEKEIECDVLMLCIGHSAIKTFEMLKKRKFYLEQKPFAMGVRVEHLQRDINIMQYGKLDSRLPSADYKLVDHLQNGRSVFSFCMCPGGEVVLSSSEENTIVTNGMSYFARDKERANSALLVNVMVSDYPTNDALSGLYFQRKYERKAFELGGGDYCAPYQTVGEFLGENSTTEEIKSSYLPGVKKGNLKECLPSFVYESLLQGIKNLQSKYNNFLLDNNLLIGVETRSSCPVKITRNSDMQSLNYAGIFPLGEGGGYAGGIISSAQDGIKGGECAIKYIKEKYSNKN